MKRSANKQAKLHLLDRIYPLDDGSDAMLGITTDLLSQTIDLRDRLESLERLVKSPDLIAADLVDTRDPAADAVAQRCEQCDKLIERVLGVISDQVPTTNS